MTQCENGEELWGEVKKLLGDHRLQMGSHWSYNFRNDPKRLAFVLSRYKFSAKMSCKNAKILEMGCSEGIGATILGEQAISYTGVDLDDSAINTAKKNFLNTDKYSFIYDDFLGKSYGEFDAIVSLDVIEHIHKEYESHFFSTIMKNLSKDGVVIIGTPNISSERYASEASLLGHVNLYSQARLVSEMQKYFHQVFPFGMNDEIVHVGFAEMCHYLICVGCCRKN